MAACWMGRRLEGDIVDKCVHRGRDQEDGRVVPESGFRVVSACD